MNPAAIAYALQILGMVPTLISAGRDVLALVQHGTDALKAMQAENRDPTDKEWAELNAVIDALRKDLHDTP